jgi:hypothetical protein
MMKLKFDTENSHRRLCTKVLGNENTFKIIKTIFSIITKEPQC